MASAFLLHEKARAACGTQLWREGDLIAAQNWPMYLIHFTISRFVSCRTGNDWLARRQGNKGNKTSEAGMIRAALASVLLLVATGVASADAIQATERSAFVLTEAHIAQAKAALRLTPEQERHWPRVAAALRSIARKDRGITAQIADARRVISAAAPLIRSLDADQKQTALAMVRALGLGHLASAM